MICRYGFFWKNEKKIPVFESCRYKNAIVICLAFFSPCTCFMKNMVDVIVLN